MARNVTLLQLRTDISNQADIATGTSGRYTPTFLTRLINQSLQRFREKLSNEGVQHYLTYTSGTLGTGVTSPFPFYSLDLSAVSPSIVRVYGVDLTIQNVTRTLNYVPFQNRDNYGGPTGAGMPDAWSIYQDGKLAIFPPSTAAYPYVVWYLPVLADLAADGDTFNGMAGWESFIVWDVVVSLLVRDNYATQYQLAVQSRNEVWADILRSATRVTSAGGAIIGRDTFGRRGLYGNNGNRKPLLPPP